MINMKFSIFSLFSVWVVDWWVLAVKIVLQIELLENLLNKSHDIAGLFICLILKGTVYEI